MKLSVKSSFLAEIANFHIQQTLLGSLIRSNLDEKSKISNSLTKKTSFFRSALSFQNYFIWRQKSSFKKFRGSVSQKMISQNCTRFQKNDISQNCTRSQKNDISKLHQVPKNDFSKLRGGAFPLYPLLIIMHYLHGAIYVDLETCIWYTDMKWRLQMLLTCCFLWVEIDPRWYDPHTPRHIVFLVRQPLHFVTCSSTLLRLLADWIVSITTVGADTTRPVHILRTWKQ